MMHILMYLQAVRRGTRSRLIACNELLQLSETTLLFCTHLQIATFCVQFVLTTFDYFCLVVLRYLEIYTRYLFSKKYSCY